MWIKHNSRSLCVSGCAREPLRLARERAKKKKREQKKKREPVLAARSALLSYL